MYCLEATDTSNFMMFLLRDFKITACYCKCYDSLFCLKIIFMLSLCFRILLFEINLPRWNSNRGIKLKHNVTFYTFRNVTITVHSKDFIAFCVLSVCTEFLHLPGIHCSKNWNCPFWPHRDVFWAHFKDNEKS